MVLALGGMAVACVYQMIYYIRCRHEKIVITEQLLTISQCFKQISAGKKDVYLIDPDIYDVFFLEKKLQKYQRQYGNTNRR